MSTKLSPEEKTARRYARTVANFERKHGEGGWDRLLHMYEEGKSFQEIASCFGVSHQAIRETLIRTGIHTPEGTLRRRRIRQKARRMDEEDLKRRMDEFKGTLEIASGEVSPGQRAIGFGVTRLERDSLFELGDAFFALTGIEKFKATVEMKLRGFLVGHQLLGCGNIALREDFLP